MKIGIVYCIKCYETGKVYIGQTTRSCDKRVKEHLTREIKNSKLWKAVKKYGKEKFYYGIIEECYTSMDDLNEMEKKYIKKFNSIESGYNTAEGGWNAIPTEEIRKKLSIAQKGRKHSKESLEKMRLANIGEKNPMYGRKASEETRLKMSLAHIGKKIHTNKHKKKMSILMKNRKFSDETRKKISNIKKVQNAGSGNPMYGKKQSEETKRKISLAIKKRNKQKLNMVEV